MLPGLDYYSPYFILLLQFAWANAVFWSQVLELCSGDLRTQSSLLRRDTDPVCWSDMYPFINIFIYRFFFDVRENMDGKNAFWLRLLFSIPLRHIHNSEVISTKQLGLPFLSSNHHFSEISKLLLAFAYLPSRWLHEPVADWLHCMSGKAHYLHSKSRTQRLLNHQGHEAGTELLIMEQDYNANKNCPVFPP